MLGMLWVHWWGCSLSAHSRLCPFGMRFQYGLWSRSEMWEWRVYCGHDSLWERWRLFDDRSFLRWWSVRTPWVLVFSFCTLFFESICWWTLYTISTLIHFVGGKGGGKSAPAPKKSKSGSKSGSKSRSSSGDRGSGGGHSGSRSASADGTGLEREEIDLFADHIGCVWDGSGCHNDLCDEIQMESRCQALSHDQDDCLGAEGMNKRCVWKHGLSEE